MGYDYRKPRIPPTFDQLTNGCNGKEILTSVFQEKPNNRRAQSELADGAAIKAGAVKEEPADIQDTSVINTGVEEGTNGPAPEAAASDAPSIGPAPKQNSATGTSRFHLGYLGTSTEDEANQSLATLVAANQRFGLNNPDFSKWWLFHHGEFEYDLSYQEAVKPALAPLVLSETRQNELAHQSFLAASALSNFISFELQPNNTLIAYTQKDLPITLGTDKTVRGALPNNGDYGLDYFKDMAKLYAAANAPKGETAEARSLTFALNTGELSQDTPRAAQMVLASVLAAQGQGINPKIIISYKDPTIPSLTLEGEALATYLETNKDKILATNPEAAADIDSAIAFAKNPINEISKRLDAALKPATQVTPEQAATAPVDSSVTDPEKVGALLENIMQREGSAQTPPAPATETPVKNPEAVLQELRAASAAEKHADQGNTNPTTVLTAASGNNGAAVPIVSPETAVAVSRSMDTLRESLAKTAGMRTQGLKP